jgi:carbon storage regulator
MLVLSRKVDQRIRIGDDVEVVIVSIDGAHVKIGIQAPRHIPVLRLELLEEIHDENQRAASVAASPAALGSVIRGLQGLQGIARPAPQADEPAAAAQSTTAIAPAKH